MKTERTKTTTLSSCEAAIVALSLSRRGRSVILTLLLALPLFLAFGASGLPAVKPRATVLLFLSTGCPVSNRYAPRIAALNKAYAKRGVRFVGIYSESNVTAADVSRHAREHSLIFET